MKRSALSTSQFLFAAGTTGSCDAIAFQKASNFALGGSDDALIFRWANGGSCAAAITNAVFRDPSAWMHAVISVDTSAPSGSRIKIYINGVQQTLSVYNEPSP